MNQKNTYEDKIITDFRLTLSSKTKMGPKSLTETRSDLNDFSNNI